MYLGDLQGLVDLLPQIKYTSQHMEAAAMSNSLLQSVTIDWISQSNAHLGLLQAHNKTSEPSAPKTTPPD